MVFEICYNCSVHGEINSHHLLVSNVVDIV